MLERDYIMRLIRQFFEALEKLKKRKPKNNHQLFSWKSIACIVPIFTSLKVFFTNKMPNSSFITSKRNFPSRNSFNG